MRALCLGINAYPRMEHCKPLKNCERDADEFANQVRALSDGGNGHCHATVCKGSQLKSKADMAEAVREFARTIDKQAPPRMVAVTFSGHGNQEGEHILMIPSGVSSQPDELKNEGFSHNELFAILYEEVHKKIEVFCRSLLC